jgi:hypothetical protein
MLPSYPCIHLDAPVNFTKIFNEDNIRINYLWQGVSFSEAASWTQSAKAVEDLREIQKHAGKRRSSNVAMD